MWYSNGISDSVIAGILAFAAGVMVTVSIVDLILPAMQEAPTQTSMLLYAGCIVAGMLAMALGSYLMPSDVAATLPFFSATDSPATSAKAEDTDHLPSTAEAAEAGLLEKASAASRDEQESGGEERGAAGAGVLAGAEETLRSRPYHGVPPPSASDLGAQAATPASPAGQPAAHALLLQRQSRLAFVMFVALSLHNLPEGVAVAVSSLSSTAQGNDMTLAIAVHNAVEGLALATPVLAATGSLWKAVAAALVSGLTEPLGALVTLLALGQAQAGSGAGPATTQGLEAVLSAVTCVVAGVMTQVSLQELLPEAYAASVRAAGSHGAKGHGLGGGSTSGTVTGWQVALPVVAGALLGAATMPTAWFVESLIQPR